MLARFFVVLASIIFLEDLRRDVVVITKCDSYNSSICFYSRFMTESCRIYLVYFFERIMMAWCFCAWEMIYNIHCWWSVVFCACVYPCRSMINSNSHLWYPNACTSSTYPYRMRMTCSNCSVTSVWKICQNADENDSNLTIKPKYSHCFRMYWIFLLYHWWVLTCQMIKHSKLTCQCHILPDRL